MKDFFKNWAWYLVEVFSGFCSIALLFSVFTNHSITNGPVLVDLNQTVVGANVDYSLPVVQESDFLVQNGVLDKNSTFDWRDYVKAKSVEGVDLLDFISLSGDVVDTSIPGRYSVSFTLNWNGKSIEKSAQYYVRE